MDNKLIDGVNDGIWLKKKPADTSNIHWLMVWIKHKRGWVTLWSWPAIDTKLLDGLNKCIESGCLSDQIMNDLISKLMNYPGIWLKLFVLM